MRRKLLLLLLVAGGLVTMCKEEVVDNVGDKEEESQRSGNPAVPVTGQVRFEVSIKNTQGPLLDNVFLTINRLQGGTVFSGILPLVSGVDGQEGHLYTSFPLSLEEGQYLLTRFTLMAGDKEMYAAPMQGEEQAGDVKFPLPIPFHVFPAITMDVKPEVLPVGPDVDVFVIGQEKNDAGNWVGKYWKNGKETLMAEGTFFTEIAIHNNDVYIAGKIGRRAVLWKNEQPVYLSDGVDDATATDIAFEGNDIYVSGTIVRQESNKQAVYWKNLELVELTPKYSINWSQGWDIAVSGNDVYVSGQQFVRDYQEYSDYLWHKRQTYWKNGQLVTFTKEEYSLIKDIKTLGGDLIIVTPGRVWRNGVFSELGTGGGRSAVSSTLINGELFVVGSKIVNTKELAIIWRADGSQTYLSEAPVQSAAFDISYLDDTMYVCGTEFTSNKALYWENGKPVYLTSGAHAGWATDIAVKKHVR